MQLWLVTVGTEAAIRRSAAAAALTEAGGTVAGVELPDDPTREQLDAAIDGGEGRRLVVQSGPAALAQVLRRLMRRDELATREVAVLPLVSVPFLVRQGVGPDLSSSARIAVAGRPRTVGVLKDDSGTVVVDHAELRPWTGRRVWVRAYVDDDQLCDEEISGLRVERGEPGAGGGVRATVLGRRWRGARTLTGRGITLACDDAAISSDGTARDQPRRKRIWWDEPAQWRLIC